MGSVFHQKCTRCGVIKLRRRPCECCAGKATAKANRYEHELRELGKALITASDKPIPESLVNSFKSGVHAELGFTPSDVMRMAGATPNQVRDFNSRLAIAADFAKRCETRAQSKEISFRTVLQKSGWDVKSSAPPDMGPAYDTEEAYKQEERRIMQSAHVTAEPALQPSFFKTIDRSLDEKKPVRCAECNASYGAAHFPNCGFADREEWVGKAARYPGLICGYCRKIKHDHECEFRVLGADTRIETMRAALSDRSNWKLDTAHGLGLDYLGVLTNKRRLEAGQGKAVRVDTTHAETDAELRERVRHVFAPEYLEARWIEVLHAVFDQVAAPSRRAYVQPIGDTEGPKRRLWGQYRERCPNCFTAHPQYQGDKNECGHCHAKQFLVSSNGFPHYIVDKLELAASESRLITRQGPFTIIHGSRTEKHSLYIRTSFLMEMLSSSARAALVGYFQAQEIELREVRNPTYEVRYQGKW